MSGESAEGRFAIIGEEGAANLDRFDNSEKSQKVISALQKIANGAEEETVYGLRNDLAQYGGTNDITFYWGNEKKGIYHIAYRRGINTLLHVIDSVADGEIVRYVDGNKTVILEKDGFEAVLALTEYGKQKSWLLSGWQLDKPDANGEVGTQSEATQLKPTFSRQELGAGLQNNIPQLSENANQTDRNGGKRKFGKQILKTPSAVWKMPQGIMPKGLLPLHAQLMNFRKACKSSLPVCRKASGKILRRCMILPAARCI